MAKYRVARAHCLGGGIDVYEGDELELNERDAHAKVVNGWLTPVPDEPPPAADSAPEPAGSEPDEHGEGESTTDDEESTEPARAAGRRRR